MSDVPVEIKDKGVSNKLKFKNTNTVKELLEAHFKGEYINFTQQSQVVFQSTTGQETITDYNLMLQSFEGRKVGKALVFEIVPQKVQTIQNQQIPAGLEQSVSGTGSGPYNPYPNQNPQLQQVPLALGRLTLTNGILKNYFQGFLVDEYQVAVIADDFSHVKYQTLDGSVRKVLQINPSSTFRSLIPHNEVSLQKELNGYVLKFSKQRPGFEITWNNGMNGANFHYVYTA